MLEIKSDISICGCDSNSDSSIVSENEFIAETQCSGNQNIFLLEMFLYSMPNCIGFKCDATICSSEQMLQCNL